MNTSAFILLGLLAVIAAIVWAGYNRLVNLRNDVEEGFATMDVQLQKRRNLIPELVAVVKGYASHEADTLQRTTLERTLAMPTADCVKAEERISGAVDRVIACAEKYPDLKADQTFLNLQHQLVDVEGELASARRYYNGCVRIFNTQCQTFPSNLLAGLFGFRPMPMFQAETEAHNIPKL